MSLGEDMMDTTLIKKKDRKMMSEPRLKQVTEVPRVSTRNSKPDIYKDPSYDTYTKIGEAAEVPQVPDAGGLQFK